MKFSKSELRQIITEELDALLGETHDEQPGEGTMAVSQLNNIGVMSGELGDMIEDSTDLDEWVEAKITQSHDYLSTVRDHLTGARKAYKKPLEEGAEDMKALERAAESFEEALAQLRSIAAHLPPDHLELLAVQTQRMADSVSTAVPTPDEPADPPADDEVEALRLPNPMNQRDPKYGNPLSARQWINRQRNKLNK